MVASTPLLGIGLAMTSVGIFIILLSLKPRDETGETRHKAAGFIFIGPIPIIIGGKSRWTIVGLALITIIAFMILMALTQPNLVGW
jgi:uncharacterized membrane protein